MAEVGLVPVTFSPSARKGRGQLFKTLAVKQFDGTAVDLTTWEPLEVKCRPLIPVLDYTDRTTGTATGAADGTIVVQFTESTFDNCVPGQSTIIIQGKNDVGDDYQLLASGALTLTS